MPDGKELTRFDFRAADNKGLPADVPGSISGGSITATVPFGTDVTALVARFETTGDSVSVAGMPQNTGTTANNFSNSVIYRVTAEDRTTRDYTVTVTVAQAPSKELTAFAFLKVSNPDLGTDVPATITGTSIAATLPFGTPVTALVATFTTTGASVAVAGTAQVSGATKNDFTSPASYRVTAADGSTQDYTVTVSVAQSSAKAITQFQFLSAKNRTLDGNVTATITGNAIAATVPFGTDLGALIATFTTTGTRVTVGGDLQDSGVTTNDFSMPVAYTVSAADDSIAVFTITLTVAPPAKVITEYQFLAHLNPSLEGDVTATIAGDKVDATVPFGTDLGALVATFNVSSGATATVQGTAQESGKTPNDFTNQVSYTVTAADSTSAAFTVKVTVAPPQKAITEYRFLKAHNPGLPADIMATLTGDKIDATVPWGTDLKALVATFKLSRGASAAVGQIAQESGKTPNDFAMPVAYVVTPADTEDPAVFTVRVTVAGSEKAITAYKFEKAHNPGLPADVTATITGDAITASVPFGTDITALIATFSLSPGATATVAVTMQESGKTANDFTKSVPYTVTAADDTSALFTVTVTVAPAGKAITAYKFEASKNLGLASDVIAKIEGDAITASVPFGTDITALIATFSLSEGARATIGVTHQDSGVTANSFTDPVPYTVTAKDNSTAVVRVTVTIASPGPDPVRG